jgi:hypothetical protein
MQMAASAATHEFVVHGTKKKSKPRPFRTKRVGHPKQLDQILSVYVLEWYHSTMYVSHRKNAKGSATRPMVKSEAQIEEAIAGHVARNGRFERYLLKRQSTWVNLV